PRERSRREAPAPAAGPARIPRAGAAPEDARDAVTALPEGPSSEPGSPPPGAPGRDADTAWQAAVQASEHGRPAEAIPVLQDFVERWPSDPHAVEARFRLGEAYYADANFPQAIVEFDRVAARDTEARAPDALYKVALSYYELGYEQNALDHL